MNKNKTLAEKLKNKFPSYVDIAKKFDTNPNYVGDIARGLRNGESEMQEVALILQSVQGEWKEHPIMGPNLYQYIKAKTDKIAIERQMRIHLALDNKDYDELKTKIDTQINNGK